MNGYCTALAGHPQCPGCDYCLGSEGGPPIVGYEWVQRRAIPAAWADLGDGYEYDDTDDIPPNAGSAA